MKAIFNLTLLALCLSGILGSAKAQFVHVQPSGLVELVSGDSILLCTSVDTCCHGPYQYEWRIGDSTIVSINSCFMVTSPGNYCVSVICNSMCKGRGCKTIGVSTSVLQTTIMWDEISLHPNPANQMIHIAGVRKLHGLGFFVIDAWGRQLVQSTSPDIDVNFLPAGVYFVRVESNRGSKVLLFIKE